MSNESAGTQRVGSRVPARLDRLPFSRWHRLVIAAPGDPGAAKGPGGARRQRQLLGWGGAGQSGRRHGWRFAFGSGALLGFAVLLIRRYVLESPRWLASHGRKDQAEEVAGGIEERVREYTGRDELPPVDEDETLTIEQRKSIGFTTVLRAMFQMEMVAVRTAHRSDAGFLADLGARDATRPFRRIRRLPTRED